MLFDGLKFKIELNPRVLDIVEIIITVSYIHIPLVRGVQKQRNDYFIFSKKKFEFLQYILSPDK